MVGRGLERPAGCRRPAVRRPRRYQEPPAPCLRPRGGGGRFAAERRGAMIAQSDETDKRLKAPAAPRRPPSPLVGSNSVDSRIKERGRTPSSEPKASVFTRS